MAQYTVSPMMAGKSCIVQHRYALCPFRLLLLLVLLLLLLVKMLEVLTSSWTSYTQRAPLLHVTASFTCAVTAFWGAKRSLNRSAGGAGSLLPAVAAGAGHDLGSAEAVLLPLIGIRSNCCTARAVARAVLCSSGSNNS
jgi:hypothetical protein